MRSHPVVGFQVTSVHSIELLAMVNHLPERSPDLIDSNQNIILHKNHTSNTSML